MDYNKYNLQIKSNYYRTLQDFAGNGLYNNYVEGCFENGDVFRLYVVRSQFYLDVGKNYNYLENVVKRPVEAKDIINIDAPEIYFKYVDSILDDYKENPKDETPRYP